MTYLVACNGTLCDTTFIILRAPVSDDTVSLRAVCPSCPVTACVIGDDVDTTSSALASYFSCDDPPGYLVSKMGSCNVFTPNPNDPITTETSTCIVICKGGICDTTIIILAPPISSDTVFATAACATCSVTACAVADDLDTTGGGVTYTSFGVPAGYTSSVTNGCGTYTPTGPVTDTARTGIVACKNGTCDTTFIMLAPPIVSDTIDVTLDCNTCPISVCPTLSQLNVSSGVTYSTCGSPANYSVDGPGENGCYIYSPMTKPTDTAMSCIVSCAGGLCDTTVLFIRPFIAPLAIDVISFTGKAVNESVNLLTWLVNDESELDSYIVERSIDQKVWNTVGSIEAKNKAGQQSFQMTDNNPESVNFYRLLLRKKAGDLSIYPKIVYLHRIGALSDDVHVYPNPASFMINMDYYSASAKATVTMFISDMAGRKIRTITKELHAGENTLPIDISGLANGSYLINYHNADNGNSGIVKFIKSNE